MYSSLAREPVNFVDLIAQVNKQIPGTLPDLRDRSMREFPHISTGSFVIDYVTGIGGIPRGRVTEFHGLQSAGKTTSALMTIAECQSMGLGALYLDYEHSIDPVYAQALGVSLDPSLWAFMQPNTMEDGLRVAQHFMEKGAGLVGMIICDSVAAMATAVDKAAEVGETEIGTQARVLSTSLRQLKHLVEVSQTAFLFINQLRDVVDLSFAGKLRAKSGPQYTTPGGRALKFYADMRLEFIPTGLEKIEQDSVLGSKDKEKIVTGQKAKVTAVKNKCAAPFRSGEIFLRHGQGIDSTVPCVDLAMKYELISLKGAYYKVPAPYCDDALFEQTFQGKEALYAYFEMSPEKLQTLFTVVWERLKNGA